MATGEWPSMVLTVLSPIPASKSDDVAADTGRHRVPSVPDLIVAATAELAGLVVLHRDKDFDLIAEITGQPTEKLNVNP